jgi:hypothetical protein
VLQDTSPEDNAAGRAMAVALGVSCGIAAPVIDQASSTTGAVDPTTGQPLLLNSLLIAGGGSFHHPVVRWLEANRAAPVVSGGSATFVQYARQDGRVLAAVPLNAIGPSHDIFVVQVAHSPTGPLVLNAYGYFSLGTTAASWYFIHRLLPRVASLTEAWMLVDWADTSGDGQPGEGDTFKVLASGS